MGTMTFAPKGLLTVETAGSEAIPAFFLGGEPLEVSIEKILEGPSTDPDGPTLSPPLIRPTKETVVTIRFRGDIGDIGFTIPRKGPRK